MTRKTQTSRPIRTPSDACDMRYVLELPFSYYKLSLLTWLH